MAMRGPSVFPELFAMIGDHDNQGVVQNSELLELANQLLQAPVVVQDLAVVTIPGALNKAIGIDPIVRAAGSIDHDATTVPYRALQSLAGAIEFGRLRRVSELVFEPERRPIGSVRIHCVRVNEKRLIPVPFQ